MCINAEIVVIDPAFSILNGTTKEQQIALQQHFSSFLCFAALMNINAVVLVFPDYPNLGDGSEEVSRPCQEAGLLPVLLIVLLFFVTFFVHLIFLDEYLLTLVTALRRFLQPARRLASSPCSASASSSITAVTRLVPPPRL